MGITCSKLSLDGPHSAVKNNRDGEDFNYSSAFEAKDPSFLSFEDIHHHQKKPPKPISPQAKQLQKQQSLQNLRTISFRLQKKSQSNESNESLSSYFPTKYSTTLASSSATADSSIAPSIALNTSTNSIALSDSPSTSFSHGSPFPPESLPVLTVHQALILACTQGDCEAVYSILSDPLYAPGININLVNEQGETALHLACRHNHYKVVKALLDFGAQQTMTAVLSRKHTVDSPFLLAAELGHTEIAMLLLSYSAAIDSVQRSTGCTALMLAAKHGNIAMVRGLLKKGATKDLCDRQGNSAMLLAGLNGHWGVVQFLWEKGANVHVRNGAQQTVVQLSNAKEHLGDFVKQRFWKACQHGDKDTVQRYLVKGWTDVDDVDAANADMTPLLYAAQVGSVSLVRFCLDRGSGEVTINAKSSDGSYSALHFAAMLSPIVQGQEALLVARDLVKVGLRLDVRSGAGMTPLMCACIAGNVALVNYLLQRGAGVDLQDAAGHTALLHALRSGAARQYADIAMLLLTNGAGVHLCNKEGQTAHSLALGLGRDCVVIEAVETCYLEQAKTRIVSYLQQFSILALNAQKKLLHRAECVLPTRQHQKLFHSLHSRLQDLEDAQLSEDLALSVNWRDAQKTAQDFVVSVSLYVSASLPDTPKQQEAMSWLEVKYEEIRAAAQEVEDLEALINKASAASKGKPAGKTRKQGTIAHKEDYESSSTNASVIDQAQQRRQQRRIQSMLQLLESSSAKKKKSSKSGTISSEDD